MNLGNGDGVAAVAVLTYEDLNRGVDVGGDTALDVAINGGNGDGDEASVGDYDDGDYAAGDYDGELDSDAVAALSEQQD
jgi:hypothetical protein